MNKKEKALQNLETLCNFQGIKTNNLFEGVLRDIIDALPDEPKIPKPPEPLWEGEVFLVPEHPERAYQCGNAQGAPGWRRIKVREVK